MQKIGCGWQYEVFDLEDGRVLKIPHTFLKQMRVIGTSARSIWKWPAVLLKVLASRKLYQTSLGALSKRSDIDMRLVGFPEFLANGSYTQERVTMLGNMLEKSSRSEKLDILDRYADLQIACWEYGFGETVYNFKINAGMRADGSLIQVDLGELTFDKTNLAKRIRTERWRIFDSYCYADTDLKEATERIFRERLTLETLERVWEKRKAP